MADGTDTLTTIESDAGTLELRMNSLAGGIELVIPPPATFPGPQVLCVPHDKLPDFVSWLGFAEESLKPVERRPAGSEPSGERRRAWLRRLLPRPRRRTSSRPLPARHAPAPAHPEAEKKRFSKKDRSNRRKHATWVR